MVANAMEQEVREASNLRSAVGMTVRILWAIVRLPILAFLIVLEPLVCGALWLFATFGLVGAFFFRFLVKDPRFPFWPAIALSIGLALVAALYVGIIRVLGGDRD